MDHEARKQVLLTRIAHERTLWTRDFEAMRIASEPRHLAANAFRALLPESIEGLLFKPADGRGTPSLSAGIGRRLLHAVLVVRRYPILLSIAGGLLARRAIRRVLVVGAVGAAVAGGLWMVKARR